MDYENPLDHLIHRFQHRWETNPQFRAAMSGVLGLSLIIFLCVGVAGVNAAASRVLGSSGLRLVGRRPGQYRSWRADCQRQLDVLHADRARLEGRRYTRQQPNQQLADAAALAYAHCDAARRGDRDALQG